MVWPTDITSGILFLLAHPKYLSKIIQSVLTITINWKTELVNRLELMTTHWQFFDEWPLIRRVDEY